MSTREDPRSRAEPDTPSAQIPPIEAARLEEHRCARGSAESALESEPIAGGYMFYSGPATWNNAAIAIGLDGPISEDDLDRIDAFFASRGVEPRVSLTPFVTKATLESLERRGFGVRQLINVFIRPLDQSATDEQLESRMTGSLPIFEGASLTIERIDPNDDAQILQLAQVATSGFLEPGEVLTDEMMGTVSRVAKHPRSDSFIARFGSVPVGACGMESAPDLGIAGLFGTSVLEPYRRLGVQQALIVHRLKHGRDRGCRVASICCDPGIPTERNAMRLGFSLGYMQVVFARSGPGLVPTPD